VNKPLSVIAILAFGVATRAPACIPAPAAQLFAQGAEFILVGTATGAQEERFELVVSYDVIEVLLGKAPDTRMGVSPCRDPVRKGERVVVGRVNGTSYVYPAETYEQDVRASVRSGR
jgi:hypothetical protein